jgi:hypothetical protein
MTAPVASGWSELAGWGFHPLESAAFARRTPQADFARPDSRDQEDSCFWILNVWTGGVSQERNLETAALGLALMYPAYCGAFQQLLATMDISAHPI